MSYRNDHDAALARIDALEHELAVARDERDQLEAQLSRPAPLVSRPAPLPLPIDARNRPSRRERSRTEANLLLAMTSIGIMMYLVVLTIASEVYR